MTYRNGVVIELGSSTVKKTYPGLSGCACVTHLKTIYELLMQKSVDCLYLSKLDDPTGGIVYLQPRGFNPPKFAQDVVDTIVCVLEALVVRIRFIHAEVTSADTPRRLCMLIQIQCSTDIRWPNIIQMVHEPRTWFLIDWEDASMLPII